MTHWLEQTFGTLAIRPFRILWLGTLTSFLGFFMSTIVNSVVAFELSGTNLAVGGVFAAQGGAMFLLGPLGGAYADRWPKRRVVAVGQAITAAVFLGVAWLFAVGALRLWQLVLAGFVMGGCFAFIGPARQALVVDLVPPARRGNAMALSQIANNASRVGGPAVAGVLLAWSVVGAGGAYVAMAALYALAALSLVLLPASRGRADVATPVWTDVAEGLHYVGGQPRLRVLVAMFVSVVMAGFPFVTVLPGLVENRLGRDAEAISALMSAAAAGGLLTSVAVARFADSPRARSIYSALGLGFGLSLLALALAPSFAWAVAITFVAGAANGGFQTLSNAVLIHATEPAFMGRVMSLTMMAFAGFGLMGLPIGLLADVAGEPATLVAMGALVCAIVLVSWLALVRIEAPQR